MFVKLFVLAVFTLIASSANKMYLVETVSKNSDIPVMKRAQKSNNQQGNDYGEQELYELYIESGECLNCEPSTTTTSTTTMATTTTTTTERPSHGDKQVALLLGGDSGSNTALADSEQIGSCEKNVKGLPSPRMFSEAVVIDNVVLLCGGSPSTYQDKRYNECYYLQSDGSWEPGPRMNFARSKFSLTVVGGRIVAAGGKETESEVEILTSRSEHNWNRPSWKLDTKRSGHCAIDIGNDVVVFVGGVRGGGAVTQKKNILSGSSSDLAAPKVTSDWVTCSFMDNKVYAIADGRFIVLDLRQTDWTYPDELDFHFDIGGKLGVLNGNVTLFGSERDATWHNYNGESWFYHSLKSQRSKHALAIQYC